MKFKWVQIFVQTVQKILLMILLWIVYLFGLGLTSLFVRIFERKSDEKSESEGSFWTKAKGYGRDDHDVMRQS